MKLNAMLAMVQELAQARGPVGQEDEVRVIVRREMEGVCDQCAGQHAKSIFF